MEKTIRVNSVEISLAETAGFCFGVARAVEMTEELLGQGKKVATIGPLIHNAQVINSLSARGAVPVSSIDEIPAGAVAVIRSHGVPQNIKSKLEKEKIDYLDATCPFVAKIQKLAARAKDENVCFLLAGDKNHPEVKAIVGHGGSDVHVVANAQELNDTAIKIGREKEVWLAAQTTFEVTKWLECCDLFKKLCTNCHVFDTICSATWTRQQETQSLAKKNSLMLIVGGRNSSNTRKLLKVASEHTKAVQIETAAEIDYGMLKGHENIGVTAGASTPASAIEEVLTKMSDVIRDGEKSFEEMLDDSMKPVYPGMVVQGVVEAVSANEVTVDIGTKQTGIIKMDELTDDPTVNNAGDVVKRGEELSLVVIKVSDQDGIIYLSKRQMEARKGAEEVAKAAEDGTVMDAFIIESNKGGLVASVKGVKVFIPASQATLRRGEDYTSLIRKKVKVKIKEYSPRRTIGSIREVLAEEQAAMKEKFWESAEVSKTYIGTVKSLANYGAFVDVGGVDGLVHISELSWSRVKHPSEVVNVGDSIEVYIKDLDKETGKISLGFRKQEDNPWEIFKNKYPVGSDFKATVVSVTQFGAFVNIIPGIDGLVHISEISYDRVAKVADVLKVGDEVEVRLQDVDFERKRISLSMKALLPEPDKSPEEVMGASDGVVASASSEETVVAPEMEEQIAEETK